MAVREVKNGWEAYRRDEWNVRRRKLFPTEKQANAYDEKIKRTSVKKGARAQRSQVLTVGAFFTKEIKTLESLVKKGQGKQGTLSKLKSVTRTMPAWLACISLPKLSARQCRRYLEHLLKGPKYRRSRGDQPLAVVMGKRDPSTAATTFRTFTGHLERAKGNGYCPNNPARGITIPKSQSPKRKQIKALGEVGLGMLLSTAFGILSEKRYVLLCLLAMTGMRVGEALALRRANIELRGGQGDRIQVTETASAGTYNKPKSGDTRSVDVSTELKRILNQWLKRLPMDSSAWVFPADCKRHPATRDYNSLVGLSSSRPLSYQAISKAWKTVLKEDKFTIVDRTLSLHCLRHTFATLLINEGEDIGYVSKQLGHASIAETQQTYAQHIDPEPPQAQAELDRTLALPDIPDPSQMVLPLVIGNKRRAWSHPKSQAHPRPKSTSSTVSRTEYRQDELPMDLTGKYDH